MSAASFMARFQSTLPYGSDRCRCRSRWHLADFNPRSLTGASYKQTLVAYTVGISIHAPLREREPADLAAECGGIFQSTLPYGSDRTRELLLLLFLPFQSTLPYGSELRQAFMLQRYYISIHAPLRERHFGFSCRSVYSLFQSTLPYGSDIALEWSWQQNTISIHAPLRERMILDWKPLYTALISIHAPLRERV